MVKAGTSVPTVAAAGAAFPLAELSGSQYVCAASDGRHLYVHCDKGLFKVGVEEGTPCGAVVHQAPYRVEQRASMCCVGEYLLFLRWVCGAVAVWCGAERGTP